MHLSEDEISRILWDHINNNSSVEWIGNLRRAAVLIPLIIENGECCLLFTRRTDTVNTHKGQVSFPGGLIEPQDDSPETTALRETYEEIGVTPDKITLLGRLENMPTSTTGYVIAPIVGRIPWPTELKISADEVSRVFIIPLKWLANTEHIEEKSMQMPDGRVVNNVLHYHLYDGELVWGITARITHNLLGVLGLI